MSDNSKIEWCNATWNPVSGCSRTSPGCDRCYALTFAERWRGIPGHYFEHGFDVTLRPDKLDQPLRWHRPRRIFVNSMSDLFHADIPDEYVAKVFAVMAIASRHTFQVLTKRHGRMRSLLSSHAFWTRVAVECLELQGEWPVPGVQFDAHYLPNVHMGVSVEDQHWADIRIPALCETPAAVRFLSCEPLLGAVKIPFAEETDRCNCGVGPQGYYGMHERHCGVEPGRAWNVAWVIVGGESGPGARRMDAEWARSLVGQCREWDVPVFVKQLGSALGRELGAGPKGGDWDAWPEDLRIREFPRVPEAVAL